MKLIQFQHNNADPRIGLLQADRVLDLSLAAAGMKLPVAFPSSLLELLNMESMGTTMLDAVIAWVGDAASFSHALQDVSLLPPIMRPGKVIAIGKNYAAHAQEMASVPPEFPMLFHKTHTSLIGSGQPIVIPSITKKVDYEGELAVIIGKTARNVNEKVALDFVAGYAVANDVSARDYQRRTSQFTAGKMLDTFGPIGPALVTADSVPNPHALSVRTTLNGTVMQDGNTSDMIFTIPFLISYISKICTLEVGDIILTGTPDGVGAGRTPPVWMKAGDEVVVEIEGIGRLVNPVKNA